MMPKLQMLLHKGNVTFNNNNKRKRFRLLNFPHCAISFHDVTALLYCFKQKNLSFTTIETAQWRHEIKDGGAREFKSWNLFRLLILLSVAFPLSSKNCNLGIIWSHLASTHANSRSSKEVQSTKALNLSRSIVSLQVLSWCFAFFTLRNNLSRNKNICCEK